MYSELYKQATHGSVLSPLKIEVAYSDNTTLNVSSEMSKVHRLTARSKYVGYKILVTCYYLIYKRHRWAGPSSRTLRMDVNKQRIVQRPR